MSGPKPPISYPSVGRGMSPRTGRTAAKITTTAVAIIVGVVQARLGSLPSRSYQKETARPPPLRPAGLSWNIDIVQQIVRINSPPQLGPPVHTLALTLSHRRQLCGAIFNLSNGFSIGAYLSSPLTCVHSSLSASGYIWGRGVLSGTSYAMN